MLKFLLVSLALVGWVNTIQGADDAKIELTTDVVYGKAGDVELKLDIARPTKVDGRVPCIVVIHGGAWRQGNKSSHLNDIQRYARAGYVSVTVAYRFAPDHPFPAQIQDVKCAIRYLRAHADELSIDPNRIGAIGFSAGAHLSMLLATIDKESAIDNETNPNAFDYEGDSGYPDQSSKVQCAVAYFGPTKLYGEVPVHVVPWLVDFIGGPTSTHLEAYRRASPLTHVNQGDSPMLLFQGTEDNLVPYQQAIEMINAMTKADVPGRIEFLIDAGHGWGGPMRDHTNGATDQFFEANLKP